MENIYFVSRHIVVCAAHPNITCNLLKSCGQKEDYETLILNRKLLIIQHLENIKHSLNVTQEVKTWLIHQDDKYDEDVLSIASDQSKKRKHNQNKERKDYQGWMTELSYEKKN